MVLDVNVEFGEPVALLATGSLFFHVGHSLHIRSGRAINWKESNYDFETNQWTVAPEAPCHTATGSRTVFLGKRTAEKPPASGFGSGFVNPNLRSGLV